MWNTHQPSLSISPVALLGFVAFRRKLPSHTSCLAYVIVGRVLRLRRNTHCHKDASFDSLLSRAGLGHLGKGWIVRSICVAPPLEDCLTGLTGSSTQGGTASSVAGCQALTGIDSPMNYSEQSLYELESVLQHHCFRLNILPDKNCIILSESWNI